MAMVNVSIDTKTRQSVMTIDGVIVPAMAFRVNKWIDMDGDPQLGLSYLVETQNENGLSERREFFLPDPEDDSALANEAGMASRTVTQDGQNSVNLEVQASIEKFIQSRRNK